MILDFDWKQGNLRVSYIDDMGQVKFFHRKMEHPMRWVPTTHEDPHKDPIYTTWDKKPVKRVTTNRPDRFAIYEYLEETTDFTKEEREILYKNQKPNIYYVDIETEILDTGFVEPTDANSKVLTIAIVYRESYMNNEGIRVEDDKLTVRVLGIKEFTNEQANTVRKKIEEHLKGFDIKINFKYISFSKKPNPERDMLRYFFEQEVSKMPVITGWNFLSYDWTFLINRCKNLSLDPSICSPTNGMHNIFNTEYEVPHHKLVVDYLEIWKKPWNKFVKIQESNSLDWVADHLFGIKKVDYTEEVGINNLTDLYEKNFTNYVYYNAIDTVLVLMIHEKTKLLDILIQTSYLARIRLCDHSYKNLNTALVVTEGFLRRPFKEKANIVLCRDPNKDGSDTTTIAGGWVKPPVKGMNQWVSTYDFSSEYPTNMRMFNLAPEKYKGTIMELKRAFDRYESIKNENVNRVKDGTITIKEFEILDKKLYENFCEKRFNKVRNSLNEKGNIEIDGITYYKDDIVCINGCVFESGESVTVDFLSDMFSKRKEEKGMMKKYKDEKVKLEESLKELELSDNDEEKQKLKTEINKTEILINDYSSLEQAYKIVLNSAYGAFANKYFVCFTNSVAGTTTAIGRDVIQYMDRLMTDWALNQWHLDTELHQKLGISDVKKIPDDTVITCYGDTDSNFYTFKPFMDSCKWEGDPLEFIVKMNQYKIDEFFKDELEKYGERFGVKNLHVFELEQISKSIIYLEKKMYLKNVVKDEDQYTEAENNLQPKGIDLVRSSTPPFVREKMKDIVKYYFKNPDSMNDRELVKFLKRIKEEFKVAAANKIEDISFQTSVNKYEEGVEDDKNAIVLNKGVHHAVKAAAHHNYLLNKYPEYKSKYKDIRGGKVRYYYTTSELCNEFAYFTGEYPYEIAMKEAPVDIDLQFEKCFLSIVNRFNNVLGLSEMNSQLTFTLSLF